MNNEELKAKIAELLAGATFEEGGEWVNVNVEANDLLSFAGTLRNDDSLYFDQLFCLTCIDRLTYLTMVYHLTSTRYRHNLVVRCKLDRNDPQVETLCHIWRTAEFHEREVYEFFGVRFLNHPDLRTLILPDGWDGRNPLRKDFEDPINMIKL